MGSVLVVWCLYMDLGDVGWCWLRLVYVGVGSLDVGYWSSPRKFLGVCVVGHVFFLLVDASCWPGWPLCGWLGHTSWCVLRVLIGLLGA